MLLRCQLQAPCVCVCVCVCDVAFLLTSMETVRRDVFVTLKSLGEPLAAYRERVENDAGNMRCAIILAERPFAQLRL